MSELRKICVRGHSRLASAIRLQLERDTGLRISVEDAFQNQIFLTCEKILDVDRIMCRRPFFLDGRKIQIRRYLPKPCYSVTKEVSLFIYAAQCREGAEYDYRRYLRQFGEIEELLLRNEFEAMHQLITVRFKDYDSVDLLIICQKYFMDFGRPMPLRNVTPIARRFLLNDDVAAVNLDDLIHTNLSDFGRIPPEYIYPSDIQRTPKRPRLSTNSPNEIHNGLMAAGSHSDFRPMQTGGDPRRAEQFLAIPIMNRRCSVGDSPPVIDDRAFFNPEMPQKHQQSHRWNKRDSVDKTAAGIGTIQSMDIGNAQPMNVPVRDSSTGIQRNENVPVTDTRRFQENVAPVPELLTPKPEPQSSPPPVADSCSRAGSSHWTVSFTNERKQIRKLAFTQDSITMHQEGKEWTINSFLSIKQKNGKYLKITTSMQNPRILEIENIGIEALTMNKLVFIAPGQNALVVSGDLLQILDLATMRGQELVFNHEGQSEIQAGQMSPPREMVTIKSEIKCEPFQRPKELFLRCMSPINIDASDEEFEVLDEFVMDIKERIQIEDDDVGIPPTDTEITITSSEQQDTVTLYDPKEASYSPFDLRVQLTGGSPKTASTAQNSTKVVEENSKPTDDSRSAIVNKRTKNHSRKSSDDFQTTYQVFLNCILNLDVNMIGCIENQVCEQPFIDYLKRNLTPSNLAELSKYAFSILCLEGARRIARSLRRPATETSWIKAAVYSENLHDNDIVRLTLVAACENDARYSLTNSSAVQLKAIFVRLGGEQSRDRLLLGTVHKIVRVNRMDRSGGIQVPQVLMDECKNFDFVDKVIIDFEKAKFAGLKIQTSKLVEIRRVCEIREISRLSYVNIIPAPYESLLLHPKKQNIWGPARVDKQAPLTETQAIRVNELNLTSVQSGIICAALSFMQHQNRRSPCAMLVNGVCASGKTMCLMEIALQAALAQPGKTVLVYTKWVRCADKLAGKLQELVNTRKLCVKSKPLQISRAGNTAPDLAHISLIGKLKAQIKAKQDERIQTLQKTMKELEARISQLELSLEDQVVNLTTSVKNKKLREITLFKNQHQSFKTKLAAERSGSPSIRADDKRFDRILSESNIVVCSSFEGENTAPFHNTFVKNKTEKVSLILFDQAHQLFNTDVIALTTINCPRWLMFGDTCQFDWYSRITKHPELLSIREPGTVYSRLCDKFPDDVFMMNEQFRLRAPLGDIVNDIIYDGKSKSSPKIAKGREAGLTMIDIGLANDQLQLIVLERILQALCAEHGFVHCLSSIRLYPKLQQIGAKLRSVDSGVAPTSIESLLSTEAHVLVFPVFDQDLCSLIASDEKIMNHIITKPRKLITFVGSLKQIEIPIFKKIIALARSTGRYIREDPSFFEQKSSNVVAKFFE